MEDDGRYWDGTEPGNSSCEDTAGHYLLAGSIISLFGSGIGTMIRHGPIPSNSDEAFTSLGVGASIGFLATLVYAARFSFKKNREENEQRRRNEEEDRNQAGMRIERAQKEHEQIKAQVRGELEASITEIGNLKRGSLSAFSGDRLAAISAFSRWFSARYIASRALNYPDNSTIKEWVEDLEARISGEDVPFSTREIVKEDAAHLYNNLLSAQHIETPLIERLRILGGVPIVSSSINCQEYSNEDYEPRLGGTMGYDYL